MKGWRYYNHAMIPSTAPHEDACVEDLNKDFWKKNKNALLARWTTDFDCGYETEWWYIIKDSPFGLMDVKAKRRYEINKGIKNFYVKLIDPTEYKEMLYDVQVAAYSAYPEKYRPTVDHDEFMDSVDSWNDKLVYGAFLRENDVLCGYSLLYKESNRYMDFRVQKTNPDYESYGLNAVLVYSILDEQKEFLENGGYICDGARSISHETNFQDYLEKYFNFRKAYCRLQIKYNPKISWIVKMIFPFRKILMKKDDIGIIHQVNSIMKMEEMIRNRDM